MTCSAMHGATASLPLVELLGRQLSVIGTGGFGSKAVAAKVVELFNAGRLMAHVSRVLDIGDAEEAHRIFRSRDFVGKLVLRFPS